ncbi:hypothetical protein GeomeDRAFT_2547 [Geobacter metallireducens RCH3]|nr:hypothetical protein GeomeDRAFT_2547 [Geobacter metallireducens RCH3]
MSAKILFVDDEEHILNSLERLSADISAFKKRELLPNDSKEGVHVHV